MCITPRIYVLCKYSGNDVRSRGLGQVIDFPVHSATANVFAAGCRALRVWIINLIELTYPSVQSPCLLTLIGYHNGDS